MSRGDRTVVTGNISRSMRENYDEHGVAQVSQLSLDSLCSEIITWLISTIRKLDQHIGTLITLASAFVFSLGLTGCVSWSTMINPASLVT